MKIILGSSSPFRKQVIEEHGFIVETMSPDVDELSIRTENYVDLPLTLARAKSESLLPKISEPAIVITIDTVAEYDGELRERPMSEEEAFNWLLAYAEGRPVGTICGVVVVNTKTGKRAEGIDRAKVFFKPMTATVIQEYIKNGNPLRLGGGFGIQHPLLAPHIERIEGERVSVVGMPITLVKKLIAEVQQ
jgi:septum formation protein